MPLRANLSLLDSFSLIPQYRRTLYYATSAARAWHLRRRSGR